MKYSLFDFLGAALVPVLCANVAACSAGYVHCGLVFVAAVRTLPDELVVAVGYDLDFACVTTFLAAVTLGVELGVHDVLVDVFEKCHDGRNVVFHVWNLNIAYGTARRKLLELALKAKLGKGVHLLGNVNVIAVRDVVFVRNTRNLTESLFEAFCEFVCG